MNNKKIEVISKSSLENIVHCTMPLCTTSYDKIFFNAIFDKNHIKELVSYFLRVSGEKKTISFLETLKDIGFSTSTQAGISLGIDDLEIPEQKSKLITDAKIKIAKTEQQNSVGLLTNVEKSQTLIDTWNQTSDNLRQNAIQSFRTRNSINPVYMMAFSGARGNVSQVRQLVAMRGLMANPQGAILEFPIQSNFREGLTITEYLISCYGARKGLVDTALRTATSGYLTRRLVDSAQHAVISLIDCGTQNNIVLENGHLENRLIGRVLSKTYGQFPKNQIISPHIAKIISKEYTSVQIRSPLTCEANRSICQLCYGYNLASGKLVQIGEAVGVIAAQSIGEPGTQLTMRTFHTGGVGVFSDQALKPILAPYTGKVIFEDTLPGHFIRTPHGKIVYMVKYVPSEPSKVIFRIKFSEHSPDKKSLSHKKSILRDRKLHATQLTHEFTLCESDLPPGSLLYVKNGEIVQGKQLIAQASYLKLTKQKWPESSSPVYSPFEGQIFFEKMFLRIEIPVLQETELPAKIEDKDRPQHFSNWKSFELPGVCQISKIGRFWVFSTFSQHEILSGQCFLKRRDLVSSTTVLYNYNFHSYAPSQIEKIGGKLAFGVHGFQIPLKKLIFYKSIYLGSIKKIQNSKIIYKKLNSANGSLLWCPWLSNKQIKSILLSTDFRNGLNQVVKLNRLVVYRSQKNEITYNLVHPFYKKHTLSDAKSGLKVPKGMVFQNINSPPTYYLQVFTKKQNKSIEKSFLKSNNGFSTLNTKKFLLESFQRHFKNKRQKINHNDFSFNYLKNIRKKGWVYIPHSRISEISNFDTKLKLLEMGNYFDTILFPKKNVLVDPIKLSQFFNLKNKVPAHLSKNKNWYSSDDFLSKKQDIEICSNNTTSSRIGFNPDLDSPTIIYKSNLESGIFWYRKYKKRAQILSYKEKVTLYRKKHIYKKNSKILLFSPLIEYSYPQKTNIQKNWSVFKNRENLSILSKQYSTGGIKKIARKALFNLSHIETSGWFSNEKLLQYFLNLFYGDSSKNIYTQYKILSTNLNRGIDIFQYNFGVFRTPSKFCIRSFCNKWISPSISFTNGSKKITTEGEFFYVVHRTTGTYISIIRNDDLLRFESPTPSESFNSFLPKAAFQKFICSGEEISTGITIPGSGHIWTKTKTMITLRKGLPILASTRGILHVTHNDLVKKNRLLITLKSRRLQTEDIVQGIPKIEQLFEGRESQSGEILSDTVHTYLRSNLIDKLRHLSIKEHWTVGVEKSLVESQQFLVEKILEAYSSQGVKISEKHVEVIVRQMTSRVRIVETGDTGLLPGELVQHNWIRQFNKQMNRMRLREAYYEPLVLGISKSVLHSESFLLAASFQEVSRILVKSALMKKRDFLRGLHENVIVGQLIPGGTGFIRQFSEVELRKKYRNKKR